MNTDTTFISCISGVALRLWEMNFYYSLHVHLSDSCVPKRSAATALSKDRLNVVAKRSPGQSICSPDLTLILLLAHLDISQS